MGIYLILFFVLVVLAYGIAIVVQKVKGRKDVQLHMTRRERDLLIDELESIEIPQLERWAAVHDTDHEKESEGIDSRSIQED